MALPHNFVPGTTLGISTGTFYRIEPKNGPAESHVVTGARFFPVSDTPVSFSQSHAWSEADNLTKNIMDSLEQKVPMGNLVSRYAQRTIGAEFSGATSGGVFASACSVYSDSSPPTISVRTKLFSPDGSGSLITLIEELRADFTGSVSIGKLPMSSSGGAAGSAYNAVAGAVNSATENVSNSNSIVRAGIIAHPEWWTVEVVHFDNAGATTLIHMDDMVAVNFGVIMYAPFVGKDPSLIELSIDFKHGFRGTRQSMRFGGEGSTSGAGGAAGGSSSKPKSTPSALAKTQSQPKANSSANNKTSKINPDLPWGGQSPGDRYYGAGTGGPRRT